MQPIVLSLVQLRDIEGALCVLQWRTKEDSSKRLVFGVKFEQYDEKYSVTISAGVDETCAGVFFNGMSERFDTALAEAIEKVHRNEPEQIV